MFEDDKVIESVEDLRKILDKAGLPSVPIFEVAKLPETPELTPEEKLKIQLECLKRKTS